MIGRNDKKTEHREAGLPCTGGNHMDVNEGMLRVENTKK
jgi:hypothetical protein